MAVTSVTQKGSGSVQTGGSTSVSTGSHTPTANRLVVAVVTTLGTAMKESGTVSGNNLTWDATPRAELCSLQSPGHVVRVFTGTGASPSAGATTFTRGGADTFDSAIIHVFEVGADTNSLLRLIQFVSVINDTLDPAAQSVSITPRVGQCLVAACARQNGNSSNTPRTSWTELADTATSSTNQCLETQYFLGTDTAVSVTFGSTTGAGLVLGMEFAEDDDPITLVGQTSAAVTAGAGTQSINLPSGLQQNDVVFVAQASDDALSVSGGDGGITTAGYNFIHGDGAAATPGRAVAWKRMGASPDTTVVIDQLAGTTQSVCIQVFRGIDSTTAIDQTTVSATGTGFTPNPGSITTVTNNAKVLAIGLLDDDDSRLGPSNGYRDHITRNSGAASSTVGSTVGMCSQRKTTAGAEDPAILQSPLSDDWAAVTVALRPAASSTGLKNFISLYEGG